MCVSLTLKDLNPGPCPLHQEYTVVIYFIFNNELSFAEA